MPSLPRRWRSVALALAALSGACSAHDAEESAAPHSDAVVTDATFQTAFSTIQAVDYLPFDFVADGCYARAYYMSMELAAKRIESNAIFVVQRPDGPAPRFGNVMWGYHVAPVIEVDPSAPRATVIDPALAPTPLSPDQWLSLMGVDAHSVDVVLVKGAELMLDEAKRLANENGGGSFRETLTASFDDLPAFEASAIGWACKALHGFIYQEARFVEDGSLGRRPVTDEEVHAAAAPKQHRLLTRTTQLVDALKQTGKLPSRATFSEQDCAQP